MSFFFNICFVLFLINVEAEEVLMKGILQGEGQMHREQELSGIGMRNIKFQKNQ